MKKTMTMATALLMFAAMGMASGCTCPRCPIKTTEMQMHPAEYCKMVSAAEHEKRFPKGHVHKATDDPNRRCFYTPGSPYYFCQMFDDHDE